jgi:hypothetical protein
MKTLFTPGPWEIENRTKQGEFCITTHIVAKDKSHLAIITPCNIEANARLIAAAPALLAALIDLLKLHDGNGEWDGDWPDEKARAAINLATR